MRRVELEQWRDREVARLLALLEAERRYYQEIVAVAPVGLAVVDSDLSFLSANRSFQKTFGLPRERLSKFRLQDLFPGEEVADEVRRVLETAAPRSNILTQHVSKEGVRPLRLSVQPFRGWNEEAASEVLLLVEDLAPSEREAPPKEQLRLADELLENIDAIVWERDAATLRFTYIGGRVMEMLGYPGRRWIEEPDFHAARIHPEDREWVTAFYRAAIATAGSRNCDYRAVASDGRIVWLRDVVRVVRDAQGSPKKLSGITVDIGAEKLRHEQLAQAEKMAALGRLAGKVTHECSNLLMILSGYSEELLENLPPGHPARGDVEEILAATDRLSKITNELLAFTRRPALSPKTFSLKLLLESIEPAMREELGPGIELEVRPVSEAGHVNADWDQLRDSILTVVRHARDAMGEGGRLLLEAGRVEVAAGTPQPDGVLKPGEYLTIAISDSGPRLDEETRARLFEPFFSNHRSGRGLASVYNVITASGGNILVSDSQIGGAKFTIFLPRAEAPRPAAAPSAGREAPAIERKPMETVLVVEDEGGIRALMRKILQRQGYTVLEASHGEEAMEVAGRHEGRIHLLLTDMVMPQMNGRELAERLTKARPDMKVLFISGYSDEELAYRGSLPKDAAFLQKPFSLAALLEKTRALLNGSTASTNASGTPS